jgi:dihydroorotase
MAVPNMSLDLALRNATLVLPWGQEIADIGVKNGKIAALGKVGPAASEIDARHLHILPGVIDPHTHLRDPGDATVESIPTGTRAAILGGVTGVFEMPNTNPPLIDEASLTYKQNYADRVSYCDFGIHIGASKDNTEFLKNFETARGVCAIKVFTASSTGNMLVEDDASIRRIMLNGRRRIAFHAEDEYRLQARKSKFKADDPYASHAEWRDAQTAVLGTRRVVALAHETGRPAHIVHVSTAEEFEFLADHRDIVTTEVLVNHLTQVSPECYEKLGGYAVMNPPIRDQRHFDAAWAAIADGRVDTLGSDHAPHSKAAKERPWPATASGLTGVQTLVPIMLDHVNEGRLSLTRLADLTSAGIARVYGLLNKGRISVGMDADFTIVDMNHQRTIEASWIASPCCWTPFAGKRVKGWPMITIVRGHIVMRDDEVLGGPIGKCMNFRG